jgi:hypothetical protein
LRRCMRRHSKNTQYNQNADYQNFEFHRLKKFFGI